MSSEILFSSDFYQLEADYDQNLIWSKWLKPVSAAEVEAGGTKLYEALRDSALDRVMADARALSGLDAEAKEWMSTTFYELLSSTGLKKLARVLPSNVFQRITLESVVTRAEASGITKFNVRNFTNMEEALDWLNA